MIYKGQTPKKKRYWLSQVPPSCGLCNKEITTDFVDGATVFGPWAIMCPTCHAAKGNGLGTGRGQAYNLNPEETEPYKMWPKTEG